jgi:flavin reductase (DIM6/NTAB) family NADH-FMN oxidoreductase RutF
VIPETLLEVLNHEGVVAIATQGAEGPHLVNTWNSYIKVSEEERLLGPAGGMNETEANLRRNSRVLVTIGSREVHGLRGQGTGFLINGAAVILYEGKGFESVKERFPWARAAIEVTPESITQTL